LRAEFFDQVKTVALTTGAFGWSGDGECPFEGQVTTIASVAIDPPSRSCFGN
jgi:hypothetical protein